MPGGSLNHALAVGLITIFRVLPGFAQSPDFTDRASEYNLHYVHPFINEFGQGVSLYDFNGDGLDDITIGGTDDEQILMYASTGSGLVAVNPSGVNIGSENSKCVLWTDFNNDGILDLSVNSTNNHPRLFRGSQAQFQDVSAELGLDQTSIVSYGACWGDINNDGFLDFYSTNHDESTQTDCDNLLYLNVGGQSFSDITTSAGVEDGQGWGFQPVFTDADKDGWPDLFIANDRYFNHNTMYHNLGDGTFEDLSDPASTGMIMDGMGVAAGDLSGNGFEDLYVTNTPSPNSTFPGNLFCLNNTDGTFTEAATTLDVDVDKPGWGCSWADFDNDGDLDLFVANTYTSFTNDFQKRNSLFLNQGDGTLIEDTLSQITQAYDRSYGCAIGDLNNDGYPDVVVINEEPDTANIWINNGGTNHWLKITLEGTISNSLGIGSWIEVHTSGETQYRYTRIGTSHASQDGTATMFGLGEEHSVDSVIVRWPSGQISILTDVLADQTIHIVESDVITHDAEVVRSSVDIFPNPATDLLHIQGITGTVEGSVNDSQGRPVKHFSIHGSNFATQGLSDLKPGIYLLHLSVDGSTSTHRFIKLP